MAELQDNKNTTRVSDDTQQVLLVNETDDKTNKKSSKKSKTKGQKNVNADIEKDNKKTNKTDTKDKQKPKFFLSDRFILILVAILGLLFLIVIGLTIFSYIHCYTKLNYYKKLVDQHNIKTDSISGPQTASSPIHHQIDVTLKPSVQHAGRAKSIENTFVEADSD